MGKQNRWESESDSHERLTNDTAIGAARRNILTNAKIRLNHPERGSRCQSIYLRDRYSPRYDDKAMKAMVR